MKMINTNALEKKGSGKINAEMSNGKEEINEKVIEK